MKCRHCGGTLIFDEGCFPHGPEWKCSMCGRRPQGGKVMAEEKKTCIKCSGEFPKDEEHFQRSKVTKDGFEGQCRDCRKKYFEDYRKKKRGAAPKKAGGNWGRRIIHHRNQNVDPPAIPTTRATPAEILIALRRGMAEEIIAMIQERYDL
jgi:hypothetical protein